MTMSAIAIPSEFDLELESERQRWLRRRFLWFCAMGIVATVAFDAYDIQHGLSSPKRWNEGILEAGECAVSVLLYASAGAYALAVRANRPALGRLAFLLVVVVGFVEMAFERARVVLLVDPAVSPDLVRRPISAGVVFAGVAFAVLFANHFFACLFMPWTFRESLRPAAVLLLGYSAFLLFDVVRHRLPIGGLLTIAALAASFMPGAAICWWRFSRFRESFRLRFESSRYRLLQSELQGARQLHESCLPPQIDRGPVRLSYAYEPMRQIGGDLLFVHRPPGDENVLNAVVLDVTGHGIRAALTVNRLLGELERLFAESPDARPEEILRGLNRYVALTLSRHTIYATALAVRVDAASGELRWASGGHPPAFVRRVSSIEGGLESLDSTAPLLGAVDGDEYEVADCHTMFAPGDVLIAYTDGVCEACEPGGAQLGVEGTQRLIASACAARLEPAHWPAAILRGVLGYRRTPVEDDTLIVAVSIAPNAKARDAVASMEPSNAATDNGSPDGHVPV